MDSFRYHQEEEEQEKEMAWNEVKEKLEEMTWKEVEEEMEEEAWKEKKDKLEEEDLEEEEFLFFVLFCLIYMLVSDFSTCLLFFVFHRLS